MTVPGCSSSVWLVTAPSWVVRTRLLIQGSSCDVCGAAEELPGENPKISHSDPRSVTLAQLGGQSSRGLHHRPRGNPGMGMRDQKQDMVEQFEPDGMDMEQMTCCYLPTVQGLSPCHTHGRPLSVITWLDRSRSDVGTRVSTIRRNLL